MIKRKKAKKPTMQALFNRECIERIDNLAARSMGVDQRLDRAEKVLAQCATAAGVEALYSHMRKIEASVRDLGQLTAMKASGVDRSEYSAAAQIDEIEVRLSIPNELIETYTRVATAAHVTVDTAINVALAVGLEQMKRKD